MSSPWISALRSVASEVPDLRRALAFFYTDVWRLDVAARTDEALYLRGAGDDHHLLALHVSARSHERIYAMKWLSYLRLRALADELLAGRAPRLALAELRYAPIIPEPGKIICLGLNFVMGTPGGVGQSRTPPVWLQPGDEFEVEIEGKGTLQNPICAET